jgi:hypothetical protein
MALSAAARSAVLVGVAALTLAVINQATAPTLDPPLERASVLAGILAVLLMLGGLLGERVVPADAARVALLGREGLELTDDLDEALRQELAWGSAMLLKATPAAVVVVLRADHLLLRRGLLAETTFAPGVICGQALQRQRAISLVDLAVYPGKEEFRTLLPDLPAVVVQPIGSEGLLLVGGWSPRCFGRGDLIWIEGWAARLAVALAPIPKLSGDGRSPETADHPAAGRTDAEAAAFPEVALKHRRPAGLTVRRPLENHRALGRNDPASPIPLAAAGIELVTRLLEMALVRDRGHGRGHLHRQSGARGPTGAIGELERQARCS